MIAPLVSVFIFEGLLLLIVWGVWVLLNLWIWQKSKSNGNLVMLVGAALLAVGSFLLMTGNGESLATIWLIGTVVLTIGYYISVKPMVAAQIAALQTKMKHMTESKSGGDAGGGAPPAKP